MRLVATIEGGPTDGRTALGRWALTALACCLTMWAFADATESVGRFEWRYWNGALADKADDFADHAAAVALIERAARLATGGTVSWTYGPGPGGMGVRELATSKGTLSMEPVRGWARGRVARPIHNREGALVLAMASQGGQACSMPLVHSSPATLARMRAAWVTEPLNLAPQVERALRAADWSSAGEALGQCPAKGNEGTLLVRFD